MHYTLSLTSKGSLEIYSQSYRTLTSPPVDSIQDEKIVQAFLESQEKGLLSLLLNANYASWGPSLKYWHDFAKQYLHTLCQHSSGNFVPDNLSLDQNFLEQQLKNFPITQEKIYCTSRTLHKIWRAFDKWMQRHIKEKYHKVETFLAHELPMWDQIGKVCFHLAENKHDKEKSFAFIATYAENLSATNKIQQKTLGQVVFEHVEKKNKNALKQVLSSINEAAKTCSWLLPLIKDNEIYHPLAWTPEEAYCMLKDIPQLENAGLVVKLPNWWKKRAKPKVQITIENTKSDHLGADALLSFNIDLALDGEKLTREEMDALIAREHSGLVSLRGEWIEVDKEKLDEALLHWKKIEKKSGNRGLSFIEGMRMLSGMSHNMQEYGNLEEIKEWSSVAAGEKLQALIAQLHNPALLKKKPPVKLQGAQLRPYQETGVQWLDLISTLGLGGCLADDMGLGKTIQVIALLLNQYKRRKQKTPSLLVLPASLLANWKSEIERFAPSLKMLIIHASFMKLDEIEAFYDEPEHHLKDYHLIITSYGMVARQSWLANINWNLLILDEAQAIKNVTSLQTQMVKKIPAKAKIALTGTPVENKLSDLWSIFDFSLPGLLGSHLTFKNFIKTLENTNDISYEPLRKLVSPYILRRLKTDKNIIRDLPDKSEIDVWCGLSKLQATLYAKSVDELAYSLQNAKEGIQRKGIILSFLTRLKQICNHPSQLVGDNLYNKKDSGKFLRLKDICEEIASRQEKVLIFTQYREITSALQSFLSTIFSGTGLVLHGGTPVKKRKELVETFQTDANCHFFVLSLKAGGTGLNLTAASHVIHFDRWWNPAVENQATDRAYRIGQKKNVLVHKMICKGTIEEKINKLLTEKQALASNVLKGGGETLLTEMSNEQLIDLIKLDVNQINL